MIFVGDKKGLDVNILTIFVFSNIFSLLVFQVTSSLNSTLYRIVKKKINTNLSNLRYSLWLLKCCKNTFLYSLIFYLKNYIYLYSMKKKNFCHVNILSFKENILIFNQNVFVFKIFYFHPGFFHIKKNIFIQSKINALNEFFLFNDFQ